MAKDLIKYQGSLRKSKELAKQYSQFPVVKLGVWRELREKQAAILKELHADVKK